MAGKASTTEVFADTCILLNFVQREWEPDHATALVTSTSVTLIVSETVLEELRNVVARRRDIYEDMVDFLLETEQKIEEYDSNDRRTYFGGNDTRHVRNLQGQLAGLDDRREILRRLRQFVRAVKHRVEHLESALEGTVIDPMPPLGLRFAINDVLDHDADTNVVTDAGSWAADGGSGVLVTLDDDDLFQHADRINDVLADEQGPEWILQITRPEDVLVDPASTKPSE
ncbi:hypothetical protein [Natrinema sp. SYSU A 869]|uniref:hypothetical protein n=1 Tax=Natrinema sp. SYSU A 869 TaxID=2871694 RepID=UPI001CA44D59|nr:hypothetical protein [Natrinema sp. SYSU A 869]